jgi:hypothetical protein
MRNVIFKLLDILHLPHFQVGFIEIKGQKPPMRLSNLSVG